MRKTIAAVTLGCKVNTYDTESMLEQFRAAGYETADFDSLADVYLINTCTVTNVSDRKSRKMIRRAAAKNPDAVVIVAGCYAQTKAEEAAAIPGVSIVLGTKDRSAVVALVRRFTEERGIINAVTGYNIHEDKSGFESLPVAGLTGRTRAYIKIQEGCENFCSYCVIPYARGPVRSRPLSDIDAEARRLVASGTKEIVVSGISVASYGKDLGDGCDFNAALRTVASAAGDGRVRLSSVGPGVVNDGFLRTLEEFPSVCGHFHLSLQSGSDRVLRSMNRRYGAADYAAAVERLRRVRPDAAITTDIIVGFPGESEQDFMESYNFAKSLGLAALHVFPYSRREGTAASKLPMSEEVPAAVKSQRTDRLLALGTELKSAFIAKANNSVADVLFEEILDGAAKGLTGNYIEVRVQSDENLVNRTLPVKITECFGDYARGILAPLEHP